MPVRAFTSAPAMRHEVVTFDVHTRQYRALWFNVAGTVTIRDTAGNEEDVIVAAGSVYPMENLGVATGNTTLADATDVIGLFD